MVTLERLDKFYLTRQPVIKALHNISLKVSEGEFLVIRGPSGSGKSTLLLTIGGMLRPTAGKVLVGNQDIYAMPARERARFRAKNIGFIFQMFHLLPYLNIKENILLAAGTSKANFGKQKAADLIKQFGLSGRARHNPSELSVGERQRTAIGRALVNDPKIILADEPTGNLDPDNAAEVLDYLKNFQRTNGTVILVSHGHLADGYADRVLQLRNGHIEGS
jgi:ABC-type lipoprotein export system ATPase subunit